MGAGNFAVYTAFKAKDGVSPVFRNMTNNTGAFQKKLDKLNTSVIGVGKSVRNNLIGLFGGYLSFEAFKNIGRGIISVTAKFEQFRISLQTLLRSKDAGDKFFNSLVKFASITPLELQDIVPAARQLLAYGVIQDQVIGKLSRLSDLAMGDSQNFSQLVYAYGKTKTIGISSMKELRMFSTAGVPIFDVLAKMKKTSKSGILDMVKDRKILFADIDNALTNLTNKDGMFYNMTIKQSQTLGGLWSTSKDTLDMIAYKLGTAGNHLNAMKGTLRYFNTHEDQISNGLLKISDSFDKAIMAFRPVFKELKESFSYLGQHLVPELANWAPTIKFIFKDVFIPALVLSIDTAQKFYVIIDKTYNFIKSNLTPILSVLGSAVLGVGLVKAFNAVNLALTWFNTQTMIAGAEGIVAMSGFQKVGFILGGFAKSIWISVRALWAQNAAILTSPLFWIPVAIGSVIAAGYLLWKNWDWLSIKAKEIFGAIGNYFKNNFVDNLLSALGPIGWIIKGMITIGEKFGIIKGIGQNDSSFGSKYATGRPINPSYNQPIYNNPAIKNSQSHGTIKVGVDINNNSMFPASSSLGLTSPHNMNLVPAT